LADYPGTVLITGETGVGKELVALGLHRASRRRDGPLVTVNCASLSSNMAVAELFGHDDRAFTGAGGSHAGFFQQAEGGTLFLDEIGELTPETQGMLLRALESRSIRPLMGKKDMKIDVRVLTATNRDLEREVQAGRFRKDLFYRLTVPIKVPPLRDHAGDVPALARHFLANLQKSDPRPLALTDASLERLRTYSWPGNVRQLRYLLEGAAALSRDGKINAADLHLTEGPVESADAIPLNLEALEAWAIRRALGQTGGVNVRAAEVLGIHRDTLIAKIKKYGIDRRPEGAR
jgi:Nif-specific regulatory protein